MLTDFQKTTKEPIKSCLFDSEQSDGVFWLSSQIYTIKHFLPLFPLCAAWGEHGFLWAHVFLNRGCLTGCLSVISWHRGRWSSRGGFHLDTGRSGPRQLSKAPFLWTRGHVALIRAVMSSLPGHAKGFWQDGVRLFIVVALYCCYCCLSVLKHLPKNSDDTFWWYTLSSSVRLPWHPEYAVIRN